MNIYQQKKISEIVESFKQHHLIAVPTETVYGLAILYQDDIALSRLIEFKKRGEKQFTMMLADTSQIEQYAVLTEIARIIVNHFFPGELTIVLPKKEDSGTIGIRIPNHPFLLSLLDHTGPLLVTSANETGQAPCRNDEEVQRTLIGIDWVIKGTSGNGVPSTVIQVLDNEVVLLREGSISLAMIHGVLGKA